MTLIGDFFRSIHATFFPKPTNFSWIIENKLAGSGLPVKFSQFKWLTDHGINTIVTVREVPLPVQWFKLINNNQINYLHLQVQDYHAPTIEEIESTVIFIENEIERNKRKVLVHCAAGKGRTGTILAAYILKKNSLSPGEAIKKIRILRSGSIQTESQEKSIYSYGTYLNNINIENASFTKENEVSNATKTKPVSNKEIKGNSNLNFENLEEIAKEAKMARTKKDFAKADQLEKILITEMVTKEFDFPMEKDALVSAGSTSIIYKNNLNFPNLFEFIAKILHVEIPIEIGKCKFAPSEIIVKTANKDDAFNLIKKSSVQLQALLNAKK